MCTQRSPDNINVEIGIVQKVTSNINVEIGIVVYTKVTR